MKWNLEKRNIKNLKVYGKNPRKLNKNDSKHLEKSLNKFGQCEPVVINRDDTIIGGHQRIRIMEKTGCKEVDVYVPEEKLDEKEVEELNIRLNRNVGEFDFEILANEWDPGDLVDWGFTENEFGFLEGEFEGSDISLPDGDEPTLTSMSFTLAKDQKEDVDRALKAAKSQGSFGETGNENSNGNALARVVEQWLMKN